MTDTNQQIKATETQPKDSIEPQAKPKEFTKTFKSISDFTYDVLPAILLSKKDKIKQTRKILINKISKYSFTIELNGEKLFVKKGAMHSWKESKTFTFTNIYRREQNDKQGKKKVYYGIEDKHLRLYITKEEILSILKENVNSQTYEYIEQKF